MCVCFSSGADLQPAEQFVRHYLLLIPCPSFGDFQKLLELKVRSARRSELIAQGVKRSDQNALLDAFLEQTAHADLELESSVLSGIDMTMSGDARAADLALDRQLRALGADLADGDAGAGGWVLAAAARVAVLWAVAVAAMI